MVVYTLYKEPSYLHEHTAVVTLKSSTDDAASFVLIFHFILSTTHLHSSLSEFFPPIQRSSVPDQNQMKNSVNGTGV